MSNVPIVQGVAIDNKYQAAHSDYGQQYYQPASSGGGIDVAQLAELRVHPIQKFQDVVWAILFLAHLAVMIYVIFVGMADYQVDLSSIDGSLVFFFLVITAASIVLSVLSMAVMMKFAIPLVKAALIFSVGFSLLLAIFGFMTGNMLLGICGAISLAVGLCYARIVWPRIPFAAANLKTALTAVKDNMGLVVATLFMSGLAFVWTALFIMGASEALDSQSTVIIFLLFLSYYWVQQVLQNVMHVTTAGVVGTWWWAPAEAASFCSRALLDSMTRALTYSFGSICFGSFLVSLVQALRALERHSRDSEDLQILSCIIQCILGCIQSIIEFINRWAYVMIGLYGFSYLEAGRNVITLFQSKGWTVIITDDLGENVMFMISAAIGILTGLVGIILSLMDANMLDSLGMGNPVATGFLIGLLVGFVFSSIVLSVVGSAVNTAIVCYVEDPAAFQMNHPMLSNEMRQAWIEAWPGHT